MGNFGLCYLTLGLQFFKAETEDQVRWWNKGPPAMELGALRALPNSATVLTTVQVLLIPESPAAGGHRRSGGAQDVQLEENVSGRRCGHVHKRRDGSKDGEQFPHIHLLNPFSVFTASSRAACFPPADPRAPKFTPMSLRRKHTHLVSRKHTKR